jgi:hypothetical protein
MPEVSHRREWIAGRESWLFRGRRGTPADARAADAFPLSMPASQLRTHLVSRGLPDRFEEGVSVMNPDWYSMSGREVTMIAFLIYVYNIVWGT